MQISNERAMPGVALEQKSAKKVGENLPGGGSEMPVSDVKAAPELPEFKKLDVDKAIDDLQKFVDGLGRNLSFSRDNLINRDIITVLDSQTNKVVRQIPSEEVVAIARQIATDMAEIRSGLLLDREA